MSAILLIKEMPKTCKECPCQMMLVCVPADEDIDEYVDPSKTKPNWCALRPLPSKLVPFGYLDAGNEDGLYEKGYNDCIDEITGETE